MIGFKPRVQDAAIASYRYRVLTPIEALRHRGHQLEVFDPTRWSEYEAVVFSKAFRSDDQQLAARLNAAGKRVILDLCDNLFYNPDSIPKYDQVREDLLRMIALSDRVICSTESLAEVVRNEAGALARSVVVAPDSFEQAQVSEFRHRRGQEPARLLWFGLHGSPNAPSGMVDLLGIRRVLVEAYAKRPFELIVCSNSQDKFDDLIAGYPTPVRYVEWSPETFSEELSACDAVVIPLSRNPFVSVKTHNRLSLALSAGTPVVADMLESYREFAAFCYLDDWVRGLEAVLLRPEEARARARGARRHLEMYWSPEAIAPKWEEALGLPEGRSATNRTLAAAGQSRTPGGPSFDLVSRFQADGWDRNAWLIAGEAAAPELVARARQEGFSVLSIGSAFTRFEVDAALILDSEIVTQHAPALERNARLVVTPEHLRVADWPSKRSLDSWINHLPVLGSLRDQQRLVRWESSTGERALPGAANAEELALGMLIRAGVRMARHVGVRPRSPGVSGFEATQPLANRVSGGAPRLRRESGISYGPFGFPVPARIFVGSDDEQLIGARLLEYTIQKYSSMDVIVEVLDFRSVPVPKDPKNRSRTGFSFCRFDIPRLCGFEGRGVYVDADMQVFTDIEDLWTLPLDDADILYALSHPSQGRTPQTSVMLLNCAALSWNVDEIVQSLDAGVYGYKELMQKLCIHPEERIKPLLPYWWNSLERYEPGRTSLLHYTDMPTQPWVSRSNPNGELWYRAFHDALTEGFISADEVKDAVARGHISPRIFEWIGWTGSAADHDPDAVWVAPYHRYTRVSGKLEGEVALTAARSLRGWAYNPDAPDAPVRLGLFDGDNALLEFDADAYVEILQRHGKGSGRHGFEVEIPADVWRSNLHELRVAVIGSREELEGSPLGLLR